MEVNGNSGAIDEIHPLQGETITLVQLESFGIGTDEAMLLQAEEETGICRTVHVMSGNVAPIT